MKTTGIPPTLSVRPSPRGLAKGTAGRIVAILLGACLALGAVAGIDVAPVEAAATSSDGLTATLNSVSIPPRTAAGSPGFTLAATDTNPHGVSFTHYTLSGVPSGWDVTVNGVVQGPASSNPVIYLLEKSDALGGAVRILPPLGFRGTQAGIALSRITATAGLITDFDGGTFNYVGTAKPQLPAANTQYGYHDPTTLMGTAPYKQYGPLDGYYSIWGTSRFRGPDVSYNNLWADFRSVTNPLPDATYSSAAACQNAPANFAGMMLPPGTPVTDSESAANGKFMIVNGSKDLPVPNNLIQTTVSVASHTWYNFTGYTANLSYDSSATVGVRSALFIGAHPGDSGELVGTSPALAKQPSCANSETTWSYNTGMWFSGSNTTAVLGVRNLSGGGFGNDLGVDQLSFQEMATSTFDAVVEVPDPSPVPVPAMEFSKAADTSGIQQPPVAGDRITYTFTSKNTGNVKLTGVDIVDPLAGLPALAFTWPGATGELLPGQTVTAKAVYAITQADIDAGHVASTATTTGSPPTGQAVTPQPVSSTTALVQAPGMAFSKTADVAAAQSPAKVGDTITYKLVAQNTGNVTLTNVSVDDPSAGLPAMTYSWPGAPGALLPGEAVTATASYPVTQTDIDAGHVASSGTATGTPPSGTPVTPPPGETDTPLLPGFGWEFSKTADASAIGDPARLGEVIIYHFVLKNTGTVPMSGVEVNDPLVGLQDIVYAWPGVAGTLLPGQTMTATADYAITDADIKAGKVANTATAMGTPPMGPSVTTPPAHVVVIFPPVDSAVTAPAPPAASGGVDQFPSGPPVTAPSASVAVTSPPVVPGQPGGALASTGVVLTVLPISLLAFGSGLFLFLSGRRRRSGA